MTATHHDHHIIIKLENQEEALELHTMLSWVPNMGGIDWVPRLSMLKSCALEARAAFAPIDTMFGSREVMVNNSNVVAYEENPGRIQEP